MKNRLRELREEKNLSLNELETELELIKSTKSVTHRTLRRYEAGADIPPYMVESLCEFFDVNEDYLLCISDEKQNYGKIKQKIEDFVTKNLCEINKYAKLNMPKLYNVDLTNIIKEFKKKSTIGTLLTKIREAMNISKKEIADKMNISERQYQNYEADKTIPYEQRQKFLEIVGMDNEYFSASLTKKDDLKNDIYAINEFPKVSKILTQDEHDLIQLINEAEKFPSIENSANIYKLMQKIEIDYCNFILDYETPNFEHIEINIKRMFKRLSNWYEFFIVNPFIEEFRTLSGETFSKLKNEIDTLESEFNKNSMEHRITKEFLGSIFEQISKNSESGLKIELVNNLNVQMSD